MSPKKIFAPAALLVLMGLAPMAQAQSSLNLYGVIDLSVGSYQKSYATGTANTRYTGVDSNPTITSFFGMKGTEDLGGGTKAGFVLESFLRPDTGASGRSGTDVFWARAANVWLDAGYGTMTLGRQGTLLFVNTLSYNPLGGGFGLSPAIRLTFGAWGNDKSDSGFSNAVTFSTPNMGGFKASLQYQFGESTTAAEKGTYALAASYTAGDFSIGGAWQTARSAEAPKSNFTTGQKQTFGMLGASYNFGFAKFFAQYGEFSNSGFSLDADKIDTKLYTLGASVPVTTSGTVLVAYGMSKEEAVDGGTKPDTDHSIFTLAYNHSLSKRTSLYAAYMMDKEDPDGVSYETGHTYMVGVRHAF